jgi:hypothetical protein
MQYETSLLILPAGAAAAPPAAGIIFRKAGGFLRLTFILYDTLLGRSNATFIRQKSAVKAKKRFAGPGRPYFFVAIAGRVC